MIRTRWLTLLAAAATREKCAEQSAEFLFSISWLIVEIFLSRLKAVTACSTKIDITLYNIRHKMIRTVVANTKHDAWLTQTAWHQYSPWRASMRGSREA